MRVITHCPACQTQFFATEEQLNQHAGKVRCGQCRHVFDARAQMLEIAQEDKLAAANPNTENTSNYSQTDNSLEAASAKTKSKKSKSKTVTETPLSQPAYIDGISGKSKLNRKLPSNRLKPWLWGLASVLAVLAAITQSVYFLRNEIALYYPQLKPVLVQSCQIIHCQIELPKQIEFIVIDDSDVQEDPARADLIYFSSTLINTGAHSVAYPNLELTLTDVEDKPVVRRIFKPAEYLSADQTSDNGLIPNIEAKIKLAINVHAIKVSGYRVFVTY